MFVWLLMGILLSRGTYSAPTSNCDDLCNGGNQNVLSQQQQLVSSHAGHTQSSITTSFQSSYKQQQQQQQHSSENGFSVDLPQKANLETLDNGIINNVGGAHDINQIDTQNNGANGNWQDEKHFVTQDGKGEMSYKAGQTVSGNGYSKFVQHSYHYDSSRNPANSEGNAQILTNEEFNRQLEKIRASVSSEFGRLDFFNNLNEFISSTGPLKGQLQTICDQTNPGSSVHLEAVRMIRQIERSIANHQAGQFQSNF